MSEHSIIENVNHTSNRLLTPDECLGKSIGDTQDQLVGRKVYENQIREEIKEQVKEQVRGLNRNRMRANRDGEVVVYLMVDGEMSETILQIRAIPEPIREAIEEPLKELSAQIKNRWEKEATWDEDRQVWEPGYVQNFEHPDWPVLSRQIQKAARRLNYAKAVHGLSEPFMDGNEVIWDINQLHKFTKREDNTQDFNKIDKAIEYLNDIGMSYEQVTEIAQAVEALSTQSILAKKEEDKKKQEQLSAGPTA